MRHRYSPLNSHDNDLHRFRFRIAIAAGIVVLAFGLLISRFVFLQVIQHDYYITRAEDNRISLVPIAPNRGVITDRNGTVMARNYSAFTLELTPSKIKNLNETIERLGELIDIQPKDRRRFNKLLEESQILRKPTNSHTIERRRSRTIYRKPLFVPGRRSQPRLFRQYPLGSIASHAIGYINRINKTDLAVIEAGEQEAITRAPTTSAKPALSKKYSLCCTAKPAMKKSRSMPAGMRCAAFREQLPSPAAT